MGTDIHFFAQAKDDRGRWVDIPHEYQESRHYLLFACLAGVRNGFGFAGVKTHTPVTPIAEGRGLPEDFKVELGTEEGDIRIMPDWWKCKWSDDKTKYIGDHSFTWMTADEVLSHDWPLIARTGIVEIEHWPSGPGGPESWSGGVSGPNIRVVDEQEESKEGATHVRCTWATSTKDDCQYFIDEVQRLKDQYGDVRLVMGFDS